MDASNPLMFETKDEWSAWLEENHQTAREVWLVYYKKHTGKSSVSHEEAVEEALRFGWIDSQVRRLDEERFIQRYTPRGDKSVWSKINRDTAERLIKEGKMTPAGMAKIEKAKETGQWQAAYTSLEKMTLPADLREALNANEEAWRNFQNFATSYQNMYIGWVTDAKREETRKQRIEKVVANALQNKKAVFL